MGSSEIEKTYKSVRIYPDDFEYLRELAFKKRTTIIEEISKLVDTYNVENDETEENIEGENEKDSYECFSDQGDNENGRIEYNEEELDNLDINFSSSFNRNLELEYIRRKLSSNDEFVPSSQEENILASNTSKENRVNWVKERYLALLNKKKHDNSFEVTKEEFMNVLGITEKEYYAITFSLFLSGKID